MNIAVFRHTTSCKLVNSHRRLQKLAGFIFGVHSAHAWTPQPRGKGNGRAIPLKAWTGPEGSQRFRLPDLKTVGT